MGESEEEERGEGEDEDDAEDDMEDSHNEGNEEVEEEDRPEGHPVSPPVVNPSPLGTIEEDPIYRWLRRAELDEGGVAFLDDILEAEEGTLVEIGAVIGDGSFGDVRDIAIVDEAKQEAALRFSGGRGFVVKGPKEVGGH